MEKCIKRENQKKFGKREMEKIFTDFSNLYNGFEPVEKRRLNHLLLAEIKSHLIKRER